MATAGERFNNFQPGPDKWRPEEFPTDDMVLTEDEGSIKWPFRDQAEFSTTEAEAVSRERYIEGRRPTSFPHQTARCFALPGISNNNMLLMAVEGSAIGPLILQDGECVRVRIHETNPENVYNRDWVGVVTSALPSDRLNGVRATDLLIVVHRQYGSDSEGFDSEGWNDDDNGLTKYSAFAPGIVDTDKGVESIGYPPLVAVDISVIPDDLSYSRRSDTLAMIWETINYELTVLGDSPSSDILTCTRLDELGTIDFLNEFTEDQVRSLCESMAPSHRNIVPMLRNLRNGFALINGCSGSGKTDLLVTILTHYIRHVIQAQSTINIRLELRDGARVLLTTPINDNVGNLIKNVVQAFTTLGVHDGIIVKKIDLYSGRENVTESAYITDSVFAEYYGRRMKYGPYSETAGPDAIDYSLASWICAVLDNDPKIYTPGVLRARINTPANRRHAIYGTILKYQSLHDAPEDVRGEVREHVMAVILAFLQTTDVVVCNPLMVADDIFDSFRPRVFAMDDASNAISVDSFVWACFPRCKYRFLVGDTLKSRPRLLSKVGENSLALHMTHSLFRRLDHCGFPAFNTSRMANISDADHTYHFQHRFVQGIADPLRHLWYSRHIFTSMIPPTGRHDLPWPFSRSNHVICNVGMAHLELPFLGAELNLGTAAGALSLVVDLVSSGSYKPSQIAIITSSTTQRFLHEKIALSLCLNDRPDYYGYTIRNFDDAHGIVSDIIILDAANTRSLGILADPQHMYSVLTRARHAAAIVANIDALERLSSFYLSIFGGFVANYREEGKIESVNTSRIMPELHPHIPFNMRPGSPIIALAMTIATGYIWR